MIHGFALAVGKSMRSIVIIMTTNIVRGVDRRLIGDISSEYKKI